MKAAKKKDAEAPRRVMSGAPDDEQMASLWVLICLPNATASAWLMWGTAACCVVFAAGAFLAGVLMARSYRRSNPPIPCIVRTAPRWRRLGY